MYIIPLPILVRTSLFGLWFSSGSELSQSGVNLLKYMTFHPQGLRRQES